MTSVMTECIIKIYSISRIIQPSLLSLIVNLAGKQKTPRMWGSYAIWKYPLLFSLKIIV